MTFLEFLKQELPKDWIIANELNLNWDGSNTIAVLKMQTGTKYQDSSVLPFQLVITTKEFEKVQNVLNDFITTHHNQYFIDNFINYFKQYYYTPVVPQSSIVSANNLTQQIILAGILIASTNVSDIKQVLIDGEEIKTTTCSLSYSSEQKAYVNPFESEHALAKTINRASTLTIQLTFINKGNALCEKLRLLRLGQLNVNNYFNVRLIFSDNDEEETYTCVVSSFSINNENSALPTTTLVLTRF